jgi:hypothetical protein
MKDIVIANKKEERIIFSRHSKEVLSKHYAIEHVVFRATNSYLKIKQMNGQMQKKCFTPSEQQKINDEIYNIFEGSIQEMIILCSSLTENDIVFCILSKIGFSIDTIGCCLGNVNSFPLKQRKHRIKTKMSQCGTLFKFFFV